MTVREFKKKVYEEYKEEIDLISKASIDEERNWQADIGVATDMFIDYIDNNEGRGLFVNVDSAKAKIAEWRKELDINK